MGAIITVGATEIKKVTYILSKAGKSIIMGMVAGFAIWLILFLPVTLFMVQPSAVRISHIMTTNSIQQPQNGNNGNTNSLLTQKQLPTHAIFSASDVNTFFWNITIGAIAFHILWGAIFGFIISSLIRLKARSNLQTRDRSTRLPLLKYKILAFGLISGLISSIAISTVLLLVERMNALPIGTFYYVLVSALAHSYSKNFISVVLIGMGLHFFAGAMIGAIMAMPITTSRSWYQRKESANHYGDGSVVSKKASRLLRYSWAYGLTCGFALWALLFVPVTYLLVVPFLNSFQNNDVILTQYSTAGNNNSITFYGLLPLIPKILYGAVAFNMFFGLLTATLLESLCRRFMKVNEEQHSMKYQM
jgi:hypothetical protein